MCKDMITSYPSATPASAYAPAVGAFAALDTALRDPARDAKLAGTPGCKNACTPVHAALKPTRSNLADHTTGLENLRLATVCAGPRAAAPRQLTLLGARAVAADNAAVVPVDGHDHSRSLDTAGRLANVASIGRPADMLHCNSAFANAAPRMAVRSL
jgi:hypothetical protein